MAVCESEASLICLVRHITEALSGKGREKGKAKTERKSKTSLVHKLRGQKGMRGEETRQPHPACRQGVRG